MENKKEKDTGFRCNTGAAKVPWASVGENYNVEDLMEIIKFLMQGEGKEYDDILASIHEQAEKLDAISTPPRRLSVYTKVSEAEEACNKYLGVDSATFVTNCTAGFEIAYKYADIKPGDEVIVPAITFIATMAYPLSVGAKIVFADVDPRTLNMDPKDVEKKITDKTKMIVPVHIGGYAVDMDPIMELARKHNILVLEDAAHGFGGMYKGKRLGTIGDFGSYSFHEVKNITSFGEGGIVVTNVPNFGPQLKQARFFGADYTRPMEKWRYNVFSIPGKEKPFVGLNYCPTEIQGLGLSLQVERIDEIIAKRRAAATYLTNRFAENDAIIPQDLGNEDIKPTFHIYQLQIDPEKAGGDIQVLKKKLEERSVTQIPHFGPLYRFGLLTELGYDQEELAKSCPVADDAFFRRFTHLPIYGLTDEQLEYMADSVLEAVAEMQAGK